MSQRPRTPNQIADTLHTIANQIATMPNPDQPVGGEYGPTVTVHIQPRTPAEVDAFAAALGQTAHDDLYGGGWQHTTHPHRHDTGVTVGVFCPTEDPKLARLREERDTLRAQIHAGAIDE